MHSLPFLCPPWGDQARPVALLLAWWKPAVSEELQYRPPLREEENTSILCAANTSTDASPLYQLFLSEGI